MKKELYVMVLPIEKDGRVYFHFLSIFESKEHAEEIKNKLINNGTYSDKLRIFPALTL